MALVASVQLDPVSQASVGVAPTVVAEFDSVVGDPPPVVKVVEVAVTFQPAPEPLASPMSRAWVVVTLWSTPARVAVKLTAGGAETKPSEPAEIVAVAEVAPAGAADATKPLAAIAVPTNT